MRDDDKDQPPRDLMPAAASKKRSLPGRALRRAAGLGERAARRALGRLAREADARLLPRLEAAVDWATAPENVEHLQALMARTAQVGLDLGFRADPRARLLFEFVDFIEQEHGREEVASRIWAHNPLIDGSMLLLVEAALGSEHADPGAEALERVRCAFLEMLCALAQLEEQTPLPELRRVETLRAYFERAILPDHFHLLAGLGAGDPAAFAELEARQGRTPRATTWSSTTRRRKGALARLGPMWSDPGVMFLINSYLLFLQSYATRAVIERFPELMEAARELDERLGAAARREEEEEEAAHEAEVIDVDEGEASDEGASGGAGTSSSSL